MSKRKPQFLTFKSLLADNPSGLIVATLIGAVASLAAVALLGISGWFLSAAGLASAMGTALAFNYFTPGALVRLMAILRTAGRYGEQVLSHDYLLGLLRQLRLWVWDQRVATSSSALHQQTQGDLLQRIVGDLDQIIKWPLAVLMPWIYGILCCLAIAALAFWVHPMLIAPIALYSMFQLGVLPWLARRAALRSVYVTQALSVHRRSRFMSLFSALITLTIRGHWHDYSKRLKQLDQRQQREQAVIQRVVSRVKLAGQLSTLVLLMALVSLSLVWQEPTIELKSEVSATWLVALLLAVLGVNEVLQTLSQSFLAQGQSNVGLKRLNQLAVAPQEAQAACLAIPHLERLGIRSFAGVYAASQRPPQSTASFSMQTGDRVRICGRSGAGKSACLAALAGDIQYLGVATINDQTVALLDNHAWRSKLTYLSQQPVIFQQSLAANLRLGDPDASDEQLMYVLSILGLREWVGALPNGLNTLLGAQGRDLSGGQARRITLARALLRKADVLLLDEPFDGLDRVSIERVCDALSHTEYRPKFLIYVSHVETRLDAHAQSVQVS